MPNHPVRLVCLSLGLLSLSPLWTNRFLLRQVLGESQWLLHSLCVLFALAAIWMVWHRGKSQSPVYCRRVSLAEYERQGREATERALRALWESREFGEFKKKVETEEVHSAWEEPEQQTEDEEL